MPDLGPLEINAVVAVGVIVYFIVQGSYHFPTVSGADEFFLFGRRLEHGELAATFTAASTSLATVLFFFMTFSQAHGLYLLVAPASLMAGIVLFAKMLLPELDKVGFFRESQSEVGRPTLGTTLAALIGDVYDDKLVKYSVVAVTAIGLFSVLLIELFVGVSIFSIYLEREYVDWALVVVAIAVFLYSGLGGFPAVVRTDRRQIQLVFLSTILLAGWLVVSAFEQPDIAIGELLAPHDPVFAAGILLPIPLLLNMVIVNLFLPPALLRTWQMTAAAPSAQEAGKGLVQGATYTVVLTLIFIVIGIFFYNVSFPETALELPAMLEALAGADEMAVSHFLFPLLFAACLAALLSTADSAILPLLQVYWSDFKDKEDGEEWSRGEVIVVDLALLTVALGLYFIVFRVLQFDLISWLFTIFSFLILATPAIAFGVLADSRIVQSRGGRLVAHLSIWGGFVLALALSLIGNETGELWLVQLNSPVAAVFGSVCLIVYWYRHNDERTEQAIVEGAE